MQFLASAADATENGRGIAIADAPTSPVPLMRQRRPGVHLPRGVGKPARAFSESPDPNQALRRSSLTRHQRR